MEDKDEIIAVCSTERYGHTVGKWVPCKGCNKNVWLSDSTLNSIRIQYPSLDMEKNPPAPTCIDCGLPTVLQMQDPKFINITPEQMEEIKKGLKL